MTDERKRVAARRATTALLVLTASVEACSLLAPSDQELLGGAADSGGAEAGAPVTGAGGTSGAVGSGGSHGLPEVDAASRDASDLDASRDTRDAVTDAQGCDADCGPPPCIGPSCANPAAPLDRLRLELHCASRLRETNSCVMVLPEGLTSCPQEGLKVHQTVTVGGDPSRLYSVILRFRGVVEPKQYAGGIPDVAGSNGQFYEGGAGAGDPIYNSYGLTIADPPQNYFLNAWMEGDFVIALDYRETLTVRGGAEVTLYGYTKLCALTYDCDDLTKVPDCSPKPLAGVAHLPDKGQFIQIDVESIVVVP